MHAERLARYAALHGPLSSIKDQQLTQTVAAAAPHSVGIGGRTAQLTMSGIPVFVKRIPLTDLELQPRHAGSTANIFELPTYYQYGLGSAGFGAWRELTAHTITTDWVLGRKYAGFPLLYHWRVLPDTAPSGFADEFGGVAGAAGRWDGLPAVHRRLAAIRQSSHSLTLFLEHVPHTVADWLAAHRRPGVVHSWLAQALARGASFLSAQKFVHFDAHFANILTDGQGIYFGDMGLALSREFDLSPEEVDFLARHRSYDHCYVENQLLGHYLAEYVRDSEQYETFLHDWIAGSRPANIPPELAALLDQHAQPAAILSQFHRNLLNNSRQTPFPNHAIEQVLTSRLALPPPWL